jgi:uncharacterized protein (TIRG00374 family)
VAALFRVLLAGGVIAWLVAYAGPGRVADAIRGADFLYLSIAFAVMVVYVAIRVYNWHLLLRALGVRHPKQVRGLFLCYATSGFLGTVVPSTVGTDAIRSVVAFRRFGGELSTYVASVVVLNALNWMAACSIGLVAVLLMSLHGSVPRIGALAVPVFCSVIFGAVCGHLVLKKRRDWWLLLLKRTPRPLLRIRRPIRRFADQLLVFERAGVRFGPIFFIALLAQAGFAVILSFVALAVGIDLSFLIWPIYGPLVSMSALIPASVSGFGVDQAAYVYLLAMVNVPQSKAFVASALLSCLVLIFNVSAGSLALLFGGSPDLRK